MESSTEKDSFGNRRPSEATIESMANHALLAGLGAEAWVLSPTPHAEHEEGFDAGLGGRYRKAVIQYKRVADRIQGGISIRIDTEQYEVLKGYAPGIAFYAFSRDQSYAKLSQSFQEGGGREQFLRRLVFVPVAPRQNPAKNDLDGVQTIRFKWRSDQQCEKFDPRAKDTTLKWFNGDDWLDRFVEGKFGTEVGDEEPYDYQSGASRDSEVSKEGFAGSVLYAGL